MTTPDTSVRRRLEALEREVRLLRSERQREGLARWSPPRDHLLGRTVQDGQVDYPETGDTFPVIFTDAHFTAAQGEQDVTSEDRDTAVQVYARTIDGSYLPEGTAVKCERIRGLGPAEAGEWWITAPLEGDLPKWVAYVIHGGWGSARGRAIWEWATTVPADQATSHIQDYDYTSPYWRKDPQTLELECLQAGFYVALVNVLAFNGFDVPAASQQGSTGENYSIGVNVVRRQLNGQVSTAPGGRGYINFPAGLSKGWPSDLSYRYNGPYWLGQTSFLTYVPARLGDRLGIMYSSAWLANYQQTHEVYFQATMYLTDLMHVPWPTTP